MMLKEIKRKLKSFLQGKFYSVTKDPIQRIIDEEFERPGRLRQLHDVLYANYFNPKVDRDKLLKLRQSPDYLTAFKSKGPLVSVRIATYNRAKVLTEKTIPSILNQTYQNFEVIIVGDNCTDETEEKINKINDERIKFFNLSYRGPYPSNGMNLWRVGGTYPMNEAAARCAGEWIAPLDDDDEFKERHIERLLEKAQKEKLELCYGKIERIDATKNEKKIIGDFPPALGSFSLNASIYHSGLSFFELDPLAWVFEEPGDWNLCKRMMYANVKMGFLDEVVTKINFVEPRKKYLSS